MKPSLSLLRDQGYRRFSCLGNSMLPIIRPGDELWGKGVTVSNVSVGDVIVYAVRRTGVSVVHRVIGIEGDLLFTRGDNCDRPDMTGVSGNDILATITYLRRGQRIRRVAGGNRGRAVRTLAQLRHGSRSILFRPVSALLTLAARIPLAGGAFRLVARPTVILMGDQGAEEMKLLVRGTVIGHKKGRASEWEISRLFRSLIDEDRLPH